jgi:hypothetical protein
MFIALARYLLPACLCVAFLLAAPIPATASDKDEAYRAAWLRRGCALTESLKAEGKSAFEKWDWKQEQTFHGVMDFYHGFLRGINNSFFQFERGRAPKTLFAPDEWLTWGNVAPDILNFMQEHKNSITDETPASDVLAAWYWAKHPASTDRDKRASQVILERD